MNYPARGTVGVAAVTAVGYTALALVVGSLPVPGFLSLAAGVALPLALLFGPVVGWGLAAGVLATALLRGSLAPATVAAVAAVLVLALLGPRLWGAVPRLSSRDPPTELAARSILEYVVVTLLTVLAAAATLGWGYELVGAAPFHLVAFPTVPTLAAATLAVGPPLLLAGARFAEQLPVRTPAVRSSRAAAIGAALVPLWLVAGTGVGLGFRVAQSLPTTAFTSRGLDLLVPLLDPALVGRGGRRVQVVVGAVALLLVAALVTRPGRQGETAVERETNAGSESDTAAPPGVTDR